MANYDLRDKKFDYVKDQKNYKAYPCYRQFYEATYACDDTMFDFLLELAYAKRANDTFEGNFGLIKLNRRLVQH